MNSKLFTLKYDDYAKGSIVAIISGLIFGLSSMVNQTGFDVFHADWAHIFNVTFNAGFASLVGYLVKNLLTDSRGNFLGK